MALGGIVTWKNFRREVESLHREMDRLFEGLWAEGAGVSLLPETWTREEIVPQLLLGMHQLGVIRRSEPEDQQYQVTGLVQHPDHGEEEVVEGHQGRGGPQGDHLRGANGQALRDKFPEADVQKRDEQERERRDDQDGRAADDHAP